MARRGILRGSAIGLTEIYGLYKVHPALWRFTARHYHPAMGRFARLHAWMTCQFAGLDVPAYKEPSGGQRVLLPMVRPDLLPAHEQGLLRQEVQ